MKTLQEIRSDVEQKKSIKDNDKSIGCDNKPMTCNEFIKYLTELIETIIDGESREIISTFTDKILLIGYNITDVEKYEIYISIGKHKNDQINLVTHCNVDPDHFLLYSFFNRDKFDYFYKTLYDENKSDDKRFDIIDYIVNCINKSIYINNEDLFKDLDLHYYQKFKSSQYAFTINENTVNKCKEIIAKYNS